MVALRVESLNSEVAFSPPRTSISLVEKQRPQVAGSEDFIPLESFSRYSVLTRLLAKKAKPEYGSVEFCETIGLSHNCSPKMSRLVNQIRLSHGMNATGKVPYEFISEVMDQAHVKFDFVWSKHLRQVKSGDPRACYSQGDAIRELGFGYESSNLKKRLRKAAALEGINTGRAWNLTEDELHRVCNQFRSITMTHSEAGRKSWEVRRANIVAREAAERMQQIERNKQTLTEIYETGYNRVVRFIAVRIGDIDEAQDLASEVFVNALRKIDSYKDRGAPMEAWLFKIARNNLINYINRDKNRKVGNLDDVPPLFSDDNPGDALERDERARSVRRVMKILNPYQRRVLELSFWGDMTIKEVAAALGKTAEQVKSVQTRAIYRLRELMVENRELLSA